MLRVRGVEAFWKHEESFREIAVAAVVIASLLGAFAVFVSSLAAMFAYDDFQRGEIAPLEWAMLVGVWLTLSLCPVAGWISLAFLKARLAIVLVLPPLVLGGAVFLAAIFHS